MIRGGMAGTESRGGPGGIDGLLALLGSIVDGSILKLSSGALAAATPGVNYSKGPWKTFSTVRNVGASQTLSIPVVSGEGNGIVRATGRLLSDGTDRNITVKINGSATGVSMQYHVATNTVTGAARGVVCSTGIYGALFELIMLTAKTANALKRFGLIRVFVANAAIGVDIYNSGFHFADTTTTITSIDLDCGTATGLAANSEALVEEGIVS